METKYYYKELENTAIYLTDGRPFKFDYLATEDSWLIMELDAAIANGVGGVVKITKEQYDEAIKKKQEGKLLNSSPQYRQELQASNLHNHTPARAFQGSRVAVVAGKNAASGQGAELPDPLQVPDPSQFLMPSVGKIPK